MANTSLSVKLYGYYYKFSAINFINYLDLASVLDNSSTVTVYFLNGTFSN